MVWFGLWCYIVAIGFIGGVPWENHRPVASHWQTLLHNAVSSTPLHERDSNTQLTVTENGQLSHLRRNNVCHAPYTQTIHTITPVTKKSINYMSNTAGVIHEAGTAYPS